MREPQNCCVDSYEHPAELSINDYQDILKHVDLYNVNTTNFRYGNLTDLSQSPYRKYIEHVLKSRGLGQSLSFLHRLHNGLENQYSHKYI